MREAAARRRIERAPQDDDAGRAGEVVAARGDGVDVDVRAGVEVKVWEKTKA